LATVPEKHQATDDSPGGIVTGLPRPASAIKKDDRKAIFGWCMYDWANSAYMTTIGAALLPAYFENVVVGRDGATIAGTTFKATSLWAFAVSAAGVLSPILGAVADFSKAKKQFLLTFAYLGSLFSVLLYLCGAGDVWMTLAFFVVTQFAFVSANVFYDAFLPQIASESMIDRISGRGYAYGYIGGGLQFALALAFYSNHDKFGLSEIGAAKIAMVMAGLWWAGFTLFPAFLVRESPSTAVLPQRYARWPRPIAFAAVGVERTVATVRRVRRYKHLVLFLAAFMLYNEGIQTVINMAVIYGAGELHLSTQDLMITLLIIQGVAMIGSLIFGRVAEKIGTKRTIMTTLVIWSGVVIYAYFIHTRVEFFVLGMVVGLVLGGAQALSRSYYGSMIPESASAEFFGFYTVFSKFSAIWGPLAFGLIAKLTGSARMSIVSLIVFFIAGLILLALVDEKKARLAREEEPAIA
jgi:UMF1 family MFS transporter